MRGRAGRQGDPGSSVFFVSMEDDLIRRFGGDKMKSIAAFFRIDETVPFQLRILSRQIESAQKKIEAQNYASRKFVLEYDDVMNKQREIIYKERDKVLAGESVHEEIMDMFPEVVREIVYNNLDANKPYYEWKLDNINSALEDRLFPKGSNIVNAEFIDDCEIDDVVNKILDLVNKRYQENIDKAKEINFDFSKLERYFLLRVVDTLWMDHIDAMSILKNEIGLQAYGQRDPLVAYKKQGFDMFEEMVNKIRHDTSTLLLNVKIDKAPPKMEKREKIKTNTNEKFVQAKSDKVVSRNALCPCGSGLKYKHCCGKNK